MLLLIVLTRKATFTTCFLPGCIMLFDLSLERRKQTEMWLVYLYSERGRQVLEGDLQPAVISTKPIGDGRRGSLINQWETKLAKSTSSSDRL